MSCPDCYACRFRRPIRGDMHSECRHPAANAEGWLVFAARTLEATRLPAPPPIIGVKLGDPEVEISFHLHGIQNGWAAWPLNFDPVWLTSCTGFSAKLSKEPAP